MDVPARPGDGHHRPLRLRQVHLPPLPEPDARAHPGARAVERRVELDGVDVYDRAVDPVRLRRRVGMVFQKPNPFPTMSIRDNVLAGYRLNGFRVKDAAELVERHLRQVTLWDEVKDKLGASGMSLSGGQQQRLCIARVAGGRARGASCSTSPARRSTPSPRPASKS